MLIFACSVTLSELVLIYIKLCETLSSPLVRLLYIFLPPFASKAQNDLWPDWKVMPPDEKNTLRTDRV